MVLSGEWVRLLLLLTTGFLLSACSQPSRLAAVPSGAVTRASVLDLPNARFLVTDRAAMAAEGRASLEREKAARKAEGRSGPLPTAHFLALSGGGDDGAFGAGLLRGWSERGDRPTFKLVTGISTGALSAPFIFLGPAYDEFTHECLAIRVARKLKAIDVIDVLSDLSILRGVPGHIRSDNGPEFIAKAVQEWISAVGAKTAYIAPGSPWENGYVESFNARLQGRAARRRDLLHSSARRRLSSRAGAVITMPSGPHAALGYKAPAPEVIVPALAAWPFPPPPPPWRPDQT